MRSLLLPLALVLACDQNVVTDKDTTADDTDVLLDGDADLDGYYEDDCDDGDATVNPGADEAWYDGVDQDCDGADDYDQDADGYVVDEDCDDTDADAHPGGVEVWYDGRDGDCDGRSDYDLDGDGYDSDQFGGTDCDDSTSAASPGNLEEPDNGIDDDCDGQVDEPLSSEDLDGDGYAETDGDCNDADATVNPGATEAWYDGLDQDCDGASDYDQDADGYESADFGGDDCLDTDASVSPAAPETGDNGLDDDCDGEVDEALSSADADGDGFSEEEGDCDDGDAAVNPGAVDAWYDGVDSDCDGADDFDQDADGFANDVDCDDTDAAVNPLAAEVCDGVDQDCDGAADEDVTTAYYADADEDGFGDAGSPVDACEAPLGYVADATDCDDADFAINPTALEVCDGVDQDCDGTADEGVTTTFYADADLDGYGDAASTIDACDAPAGFVENADDCDDTTGDAYPGATETCDERDNDCDGTTDEGVTTTFYADADSDGFGDAVATAAACSAPSGYVANDTDCDDANAAISPADVEICNSTDDDCDGSTDEGVTTTYYYDGDGDGYGTATTSTAACSAPSGYVVPSTDCNDADASVSPGDAEICNDVDDDCDGTADDGLATTTYYADTDGDGYGDPATAVSSCDAVSGYVTTGTDCDDGDVTSHPGASEVSYDTADNDCDGYPDDMAVADEADWTIIGEDGGDAVGGCWVTSDFDDDGEPDLLVGAPAYDSWSGDYGVLGFHDDDDLDTPQDITGGWMYLLGNSGDDKLGNDYALLSDYGGDGDPTIAIAAYEANVSDASDAGIVYLLEPADPWFSSAASDWADGAIYGRTSTSNLGYSLASGDMDADGYLDLAIGAPGDEGAKGQVYVALADDSFYDETYDDPRELSYYVRGVSGSDHLGYSVQFGDFNGDGYDDLVACSPDDDDGATSTGTCWLDRGSASPSAAGTTISSIDDAVITGSAASDQVGLYPQSLSAGDLDGDDRDDLAVGVPGYDGTAANGGAVAIWRGADLSGSETLTGASWLVRGDGALGTSVSLDGDVTGDGVVDLLAGAVTVSSSTGRVYLFEGGQPTGTYSLPTDQYASWEGEAAGDGFGWWISGVDDLDADGRDDFCASATGDDDGGSGAGKAYVVKAYP